MATDQTKQSFYREVDRFRYQTNWGCLFWAILLFIAVITGAWWLWQKYGGV